MAEPVLASGEDWKKQPALASAAPEPAPVSDAEWRTTRLASPGVSDAQTIQADAELAGAEGEGSLNLNRAGLMPAQAPRVKTVQLAGLPSGFSGGEMLGQFKNTYYDFPSEGEYSGSERVSVYNARCEAVAEVPDAFFQRLCVQGSGTLLSGGTLSFSKRNCSCAARCERTGQHLCFDALDADKFPWGRGATGKPISALRTLAVDSSQIPLGSLVYLAEFDGLALPSGGQHDGCFLAQDRGLWVRGRHVDVFAGTKAMRLAMEKQVPTGRGVTLVLDSPRCHAVIQQGARLAG